MPSIHRIEIATLNNPDQRQVYTVYKELTEDQLSQVGAALANPVNQRAECFTGWRTGQPEPAFDWTLEIGFLPGVTDNVGQTARQIIEDLLNISFSGQEAVFSSQLRLWRGISSRIEAETLAAGLVNPLIHRWQLYSPQDWEAGRAEPIVLPLVRLRQPGEVAVVDLAVSDAELTDLGKKGIADPDGSRRGPLALTFTSMEAIRDYFARQRRWPTDIELESIAQTWSEHCKHTIFADPLDELTDGLYKTYIKGATERIRRAKGDRDRCVSVFSDNSGAIRFDNDYLITHKVETHNSPSALDPFGGSITGIGGVNRDAIGFGLGAQPVINTYGFCVGNPRDETPLYRDASQALPMLSPARILEGVVAGVNAGGNQSGIPTPQGFVWFDDGYKGKPLVFVGTVGLIPAWVRGAASHQKQARPGDLIVIVGGRVGLDGIHGATFSSETLDSGSPATAVQIGDPITQKKLSDAIVKEARDLELYSSITDNGAGGLSCSVAEMAREAGGFRVQLDQVPLKYANLAPWQIWVSESQERMTLAVPPRKWEALRDLMERRGVEATVIGEFTAQPQARVLYHGQTVLDLDMEFLHNGMPPVARQSVLQPALRLAVTPPPEQADWSQELLAMLRRPNLASFGWISQQYDHEVQAGSVLKPLVGRGRVNAEATVTRPVLTSQQGVALSQGLYPTYSDLDAYAMAAASIDTAVRNLVAVGAGLDTIAILDNFCWCSSNDSHRLGQLKEAARACYDYAVAYGTPFISGKDSMFNDFSGFDTQGQPVQISIPPTLLISSIGLVPDARRAVSLDVKQPGDVLYVLGQTHDELGGSEYWPQGERVPQVEADRNLALYQALARAIGEGLVASATPVGRGGLAIALARAAMAGGLGLETSVAGLPGSAITPAGILFGESQGRIVVSVAPEQASAFEASFRGHDLARVGRVTSRPQLVVTGLAGQAWCDVSLAEALTSYHHTEEER